MLYTSKRTVGELDLAELSLQGVILASGLGEKSAKFPCGGACARLPLVSQANPVLIFVTHCWENSDDYLRVFEYLESQRNFFYRNYSTPEQRPQGDKEALRAGEHTSELQSRVELVCRLLLEKKKQKNKSH